MFTARPINNKEDIIHATDINSLFKQVKAYHTSQMTESAIVSRLSPTIKTSTHKARTFIIEDPNAHELGTWHFAHGQYSTAYSTPIEGLTLQSKPSIPTRYPTTRRIDLILGKNK